MKLYFPIILLTFGLLMFSCETEYEFQTYAAPQTTFSFVAADSIYQLSNVASQAEDSLSILSDELNTLDSSLLALTDSIQAIEIARDSGNFSFDEVLAQFEILYANDSIIKSQKELYSTDYQLLIDSIGSIISILNQGIALPEFVRPNFGTEVKETYEDSSATFIIPLNINDTLSTYEIGLNRNSYQIALTHTNGELITADLAVKISISDLQLFQYTFDSVLVYCPTNTCLANEATVTCYY